MPIVRKTIDISKPGGYIDQARVDATTEEEIAAQIAEDEAEALRDSGRYLRRIRRRLGLSQVQLAERTHVSVGLIRQWEQGKSYPSGAAQALYRILDTQPEAALSALERRGRLPRRRRLSAV